MFSPTWNPTIQFLDVELFQLGKTCETMSLSCTPMWLSGGCEDGGDFLEVATSDDLVKERSVKPHKVISWINRSKLTKHIMRLLPAMQVLRERHAELDNVEPGSLDTRQDEEREEPPLQVHDRVREGVGIGIGGKYHEFRFL